MFGDRMAFPISRVDSVRSPNTVAMQASFILHISTTETLVLKRPLMKESAVRGVQIESMLHDRTRFPERGPPQSYRA
jgi:hypothetical protein